VHCAFDLLELDGRDLRREPIEKCKALLRLVNWEHAENDSEELDNGAVEQRDRRNKPDR
jgi:ATP-dependent DNA ligase